MATNTLGYYTIPGKRIVLEEAGDILIHTPDGVDVLWGDRWDHLDGVTLVVYRDNQVLHTYLKGEWLKCESMGQRIELDEETNEEN